MAKNSTSSALEEAMKEAYSEKSVLEFDKPLKPLFHRQLYGEVNMSMTEANINNILVEFYPQPWRDSVGADFISKVGCIKQDKDDKIVLYAETSKFIICTDISKLTLVEATGAGTLTKIIDNSMLELVSDAKKKWGEEMPGKSRLELLYESIMFPAGIKTIKAIKSNLDTIEKQKLAMSRRMKSYEEQMPYEEQMHNYTIPTRPKEFYPDNQVEWIPNPERPYARFTKGDSSLPVVSPGQFFKEIQKQKKPKRRLK